MQSVSQPHVVPPGVDEHLESSGSTDSLQGKQEPQLTLEWIAPTAAKVGQAGDYTLVVHNTCNIPLQQVLVRVRIPQGMQIGGTEPKAAAQGNVLVWEFGTLLPHSSEKTLQMNLTAETKGDLTRKHGSRSRPQP